MVHGTKTGVANVMHCSYKKSKRVRKFVLTAESFAFENGFDIGFTIAKFLEHWLH